MIESTQYDFDAIVVGSGISGGWAAKELTEQGLKVLVLERGRDIIPGVGYSGEHAPNWKLPYQGKKPRELYEQEYPMAEKVYGFSEANRQFWMNENNVLEKRLIFQQTYLYKAMCFSDIHRHLHDQLSRCPTKPLLN